MASFWYLANPSNVYSWMYIKDTKNKCRHCQQSINTVYNMLLPHGFVTILLLTNYTL